MSTNRTSSGYAYSKTWYDAAHKPKFAVDGLLTTFWSGSNLSVPDWFQLVFSWKEVIDRIVITADDTYPLNAPATFTIIASNTGAFSGEEAVLDTQSSLSWTSEETKTFDFTNTTAYRYYRINMTVTDGGPNFSFSQIAFWDRSDTDTASPYTYGSDVTATATATADSSYAAFLPPLAIDDNSATNWSSALVKSAHWWQAYFATALQINKLTLLPRSDYPQNTGHTFTLSGSNTGAFAGEEVEVLSIIDIAPVEALATRSFEFINASTYNYYRLDILDYDGSDATSIAELELMVGTLKVDTPVITPTSGAYPSSQSISMSCGTSGASIYYTTDGSTPDATDTLYSSSFALTSAKTIKAIGIKSGVTDSAVVSETYTISAAAAAAQPIIIILT